MKKEIKIIGKIDLVSLSIVTEPVDPNCVIAIKAMVDEKDIKKYYE
jgi:hypothetical protein